MASRAQIEANRRNAQKSTGPTSERGKGKIAGNALRHGLRAAKLVCFDETEDDFLAFHAAQHAVFAPADAVEEQLVERISLCAWRLRRAYRAEAEMFNAFRHTRPQLHNTEVATVFDVATREMSALARYEVMLDRALQRTLMMLERRQARRRGEAVLPPIAVEISEGSAADVEPKHLAPDLNFRTKPIFVVETAPSLTKASDGSLEGPR